MNFKRKVKFLKQCEENINKLEFYLDLSNKDLTSGPCLILKRYYKWVLKHIYHCRVNKQECEEFFLSFIEKLDYKVVSNMEYIDFRDLLLAYYSLGEFYYQEKNLEKAKEYFLKVTDMMEESLKGGNKYQTEEIESGSGVIIFELLMWARKNIGNIVGGAEGLKLYESIIGEEECLYIEKHYSIFEIAKELNMVATANEAARSVMKILSTYKGINIDVVNYLIENQDYENALELATEEYMKDDITHWINEVNVICRKGKNLKSECVHKIIKFLNLLISDLKIVEWSTLAYSVYINVRETQDNQIIVLNYLRDSFNKINSEDFNNCGQSLMVLKNIYEDIRVEKYEKVYLRQYEFDFTLYLMNAAVQNQSFEKGLESAAKLQSIIEVSNINKELYPYIEQCLKLCEENMVREDYEVDSYPWNYLYIKLAQLSKEYGVEDRVNELDIARNSFNKIIIGIDNIEDEKIAEMINEAVGMEVFLKQQDLLFIANEPMEVEGHIKERYTTEVLVKTGLLKPDSCIITYKNARLSRLADRNVILVDGHRELRDMDLTYIKHILTEGINSKVIILIDSKAQDFEASNVHYNENMIKKLTTFDNIEVVDVSELSSKKELLEYMVGEIPKSVTKHKFKVFNEEIANELKGIRDDIREVKASFKERRYIVAECGREYSYIEEEINNNHKEFSAKVNNDIEFLRKYAGGKIAGAIPDLLETRFGDIDDLEELSSLKDNAEEIFSRAVEGWCSKNIYKLLFEQFQVYIAKYSTYYSFHQETIGRINENRKTLIESYPEFSENMVSIEVKPLEEIIQEFMINYESYLQSINYKTTIIPSENIFSAVKEGIKVMFLKNEERADNARMKIKSLVLENHDKISEALIDNLTEKLKVLQDKLQEIINEVFQGAKESVEKEKAMVEGTVKTIDEEYSIIEKKNSAVEEKMEFVEIEALKYSKEVENGVIYSGDKCYAVE